MMGVMIQTAFLVIVILAVQKSLDGKLHAYVRYGLWLLVALRLMIPVNFIDSRFSMLRIAEAIQLSNAAEQNADLLRTDSGGQADALNGQETSLENVLQSTNAGFSREKFPAIENTVNTAADAVQIRASDNRQTDNTLQSETTGQKGSATARRINMKHIQSAVTEACLSGTVNKIFYAIWFTGSLLVVVVLSFCHFRFQRRLWKSRELYTNHLHNTIKGIHVPIYRVKDLETPCLVGLVHPAIYIDKDIDTASDCFRYTITHEEMHYLHRDNIWAFLRVMLVTVYWFHPFVWMAAALSVRDGEIACDFGTVRRLGKEERFAYGEMLLNLSKFQRDKRVYFYGTMLRPGKSELKSRILRLTQTNSSRAWAGILTILLMVITAGCAFTGVSKTDINKEIILVNEADKDSTDAAADDNANITADGKEARGEHRGADEEDVEKENLSDNEDVFNMEPRQLQATPAEISGETPFGADGPWLDYAGGMGTDQGSRIIFHDYFGLIVYDLDNREIMGSLNLASIGCNMTQGDDACQVAVAEDGTTVWLHPMSKRYMYRYEVDENLLYQEPLVKTFELDLENKELFDRYSASEEESTYWHSNYLYEEYKDANGLHQAYIYLYVFNAQDASDSGLMLRNLECSWDDMIFKLFEDGVVVQDDFPYDYHGNVVDEEITYDKPCDYTRISDAFGSRTHPVTGEMVLHEGIDLVAAEGTDITAAADGVVYETGYSAKYGNYVVLRHVNGDMTYYCQCKEVIVKKDDQVKRGEKIAAVGQTGEATGSHLHFALSRHGMFVNPVDNMDITLDMN